MGRSKKSSASSRAARKAERELQRQFVALGLASPPRSPTRNVQRPERPAPSDPYIEEPRFRSVLEYLVKSALSEFGLIKYTPPKDLTLGADFPFAEMVKLLKISLAQTEIWYPYWKEFFRTNYLTMADSIECYLTSLFKGLRYIHSRHRSFYENLLAGHSFVYCATIYFCYNGWMAALRHPIRVLNTHFENQLRVPFARAGGFHGLANFCEKHNLLNMYELYFDYENSPYNVSLAKDVKTRTRQEFFEIKEDYGHLLSQQPRDDDPDTILQVMAWVHHQDLEADEPKRIVGNEWRFKDPLLANILLKRLITEERRVPGRRRGTVRRREREEPEISAPRRLPMVDVSILENLKKVLDEFNANIFEVEKMAEHLLD